MRTDKENLGPKEHDVAFHVPIRICCIFRSFLLFFSQVDTIDCFFSRSLGDDGMLNDTHNETTTSEASGDITLDSVKDHIVSQSLEISTIETAGGSRTERVETVSRIVESVSVVRTQQIVAGEVRSQQIVVGEVVLPPPPPPPSTLPPPEAEHIAG
jgi:hypothetical protein